MQRYSVQYMDASGEWVHYRAFRFVTPAVAACDNLASRGYNARVMDTHNWSGPAVAYREGQKAR